MRLLPAASKCPVVGRLLTCVYGWPPYPARVGASQRLIVLFTDPVAETRLEGSLDDAAVLAELADPIFRPPDPHERPGLRYTARVVGHGDHRLDVELRQGGVTVRTWIALPESLRPMPWLTEWSRADDARAWIGDLTDWLDEEMYTGGLGPAYARICTDGQPRFVVDGYGFRQDDSAEHHRLRRAVGPHGWHASLRRGQIKNQYAAEWALDRVEQQLRRDSLPELLEAEELEWSLTSPDGVAIYVEVSAKTGGQATEFTLDASCGFRRQPVGRRRITRRA